MNIHQLIMILICFSTLALITIGMFYIVTYVPLKQFLLICVILVPLLIVVGLLIFQMYKIMED